MPRPCSTFGSAVFLTFGLAQPLLFVVLALRFRRCDDRKASESRVAFEMPHWPNVGPLGLFGIIALYGLQRAEPNVVRGGQASEIVATSMARHANHPQTVKFVSGLLHSSNESASILSMEIKTRDHHVER